MKIHKLIILFWLNLTLLVNASLVMAQTTNIRAEYDRTPDNQKLFKLNIGDYISPAIEFLIIIGALICLFMIIASALKWMTSSGDKGKIEEASKKITSAIVGLAILACAWIIWKIVLNFLGINQSSTSDLLVY